MTHYMNFFIYFVIMYIIIDDILTLFISAVRILEAWCFDVYDVDSQYNVSNAEFYVIRVIDLGLTISYNSIDVESYEDKSNY